MSFCFPSVFPLELLLSSLTEAVVLLVTLVITTLSDLDFNFNILTLTGSYWRWDITALAAPTTYKKV
jgi:hypothetical protein